MGYELSTTAYEPRCKYVFLFIVAGLPHINKGHYHFIYNVQDGLCVYRDVTLIAERNYCLCLVLREQLRGQTTNM